MSVIIPTRDRWLELSTRGLPSALGQEAIDLEVVVVDDGSKDATETGLAAIRDPRLRIMRHTRPQGLARARNAGISSAKGPWVAFLDDDDIWAPNKLRSQVDLARSAEASFVYSPAIYVDRCVGIAEFASAPDPDDLLRALLRGVAVPAGGSNVLVATKAIRRVGGFDERFVHLSDFDCWIRIIQTCRAARNCQPLVAYMQHPQAMHLAAGRRLLVDVGRLHAKYRADYTALGERFDGEGFLTWIAYQHRVAGRLHTAAKVYALAAVRYRNLRHLARATLLLTGERNLAKARRVRNKLQSIPGNRRDRGSATGRFVDAKDPMEEAPDWLVPYLGGRPAITAARAGGKSGVDSTST